MANEKIERVTIYILDDHQIVRKGLSQYINESDEFVVCGGAGDASTAIQEINSIKPDLVIADISLEGANGFEFAKALKERHKNIYVLFHSMHNEIPYVERAMRAGADGYVCKNEPIENVLIAAKTILKGERYLSKDLKDKLLNKLIDGTSAESVDPISRLTNREFEVFKRIGKGFSMNEIADELRLSVKTVQTYRERIKEKLNIKKSKDLVHFSFQWITANIKE
ncbi:response regulator [Spirochaetota bacterium]